MSRRKRSCARAEPACVRQHPLQRSARIRADVGVEPQEDRPGALFEQEGQDNGRSDQRGRGKRARGQGRQIKPADDEDQKDQYDAEARGDRVVGPGKAEHRSCADQGSGKAE